MKIICKNYTIVDYFVYLGCFNIMISNIKTPIILTLFSVAILGCKNGETIDNQKISEKSGGTFVMAENNPIATLYPLSITSQVEGLVASQIHESLLKLDSKTLELTPGLAEKWEFSTDNKTITFHLKKGVRFQDDKCYPNGQGPEVTSKDVLFTLNNLATNSSDNYQFSTILKDRIVGVNDFYDKKATSIAGIKIIDDYTFTIELTKPSLGFMKLLTNPSAAIINETAFKAYGKNIKTGAGPFMYSSSSNANRIVLCKNPRYYMKDSAGCALPYLDTVIVETNITIEEGLASFENQKIDLINTLPSLRVKEIVEKNIQEFISNPPKNILYKEPEMISQFYVFNTTLKPFDDVKVRKAINYAINRDKLIDNVLQGQAMGASVYGITPSTFNGYDIKKINGYSLDVEKAKQLLSEAGFPNGKGFPEVRVLVNSGNSRNSSVAVELQKQLKENLNINVNFESLPNNQKYELQMHGKGDVFRDAWVADFPSPESFLSLFVSDGVPKDISSPSYPNTSRYNNVQYDEYFKKGRDAFNKDSSYVYFMKAEQLMIDDAVIIPLWYEGSYRLITNKVKGLYLNAMRYYDLTKTYKAK